jgi:hypothetical protein
MTQPTFDDIFSNHGRAAMDDRAEATGHATQGRAGQPDVGHRAARHDARATHATFVLDTANLAFAELRADPVAWALEEAERAEWDGVIGDGVEGDS